MASSVQKWFGDSFQQLNPLIQQLHSDSCSVIQGDVHLEYGTGLAGIIGKRVGAKLGLPPEPGKKHLKVEIEFVNDRLRWSRTFDSTYIMVSTFEPNRSYPDGFWREKTGALTMDLGVEIIDGGWHWRQRRFSFKRVPLPIWLFPSSRAYKTIIDGMYEFSVCISLPVFGKLLSYSGKLEVV